jgi:hypothetical protein
MTSAPHVYEPPLVADATIPSAVANYLDGSDLLGKSQALRLSTVDADGWSHASLLSAGDMLAVGPDTIRFVVFGESVTTANLKRDGRLTVTMVVDGGMCELRLQVTELALSVDDVPLTCFEGRVESTRTHVANYAALTEGITFALADSSDVLARWERQIVALRSA